MQTASYSLSRSGNVLDLDAYRQRRAEALRPAAPDGDAFWEPWQTLSPQWEAPRWKALQEDDGRSPAVLSFGDAPIHRKHPAPGAVLDLAASAAMIVSALAAAAMVLF